MKIIQKKINFCIIFFTLFAFVALSNAIRIQFSHHYILEYDLIDNNRSIEFKIQTINVTGWVGLGLNGKTADMNGADFFIGGYRKSNESIYENDYHVPLGSGNTRPTVDIINNWNVIEIKEVDNQTEIHLTRQLNTGDKQEDVIIEDKKMYIIWSYHEDNDNVAEVGHTAKGFREINLVGTENPPANSTAPYLGNIGLNTLITTGLVVAGLRI